jgi:isoleucyl-tRNA synthetase
MSTKFTEYKGLDLPTVASEVLDFWKKENIFEQSVTTREGKPQYVFYEGPPSANGLPGIHHVMARAIKDIFCRYHTQKGYQVKRKAGWDTHGLPVELGTEKELGITKEDIGKTITVEEYNEACKRTVMRYTDVWNDLTEKMGYWVDMEDPYVTYKPKYMETVWWLLKQIYNKGLLYKGYTIQPYSPKAGTGLSSHEVNQPGAYRDVTDTTIVAQFKANKEQVLERFGIDDDVYLLAWTTTPWTLPSNTALAIHPTIDYQLIKTFNQYTGEPIIVILAKSLVGYQFKGGYIESDESSDFEIYKIGDKKIPFKVLRTIESFELEGLKYDQLLPYVKPYENLENAENAFQVILARFVTDADGTGIVHIAPTFGAEDAKAANEAKIPPMLVPSLWELNSGNPSRQDDGDNFNFSSDTVDNLMPLVDTQGKFVDSLEDRTGILPNLAGKFVKNDYYEKDEAPEKSVDVEIAIYLKEANRAFKVEKYVHSYPHSWRTDEPLLYYPLDSWFIKVTDVKDKMFGLNDTINWKPKATGEGRFGNWLKNANDWNLSRSRYWGIPLPIWRTEDKTEEVLIGSAEELYNEIEKAIAAGVMSENPFKGFEPGNMSDANYDLIDLHKNVVDAITLVSASGKEMKREADLIDVWFDSGAMPYAQWHYPFENKDLIDNHKAFPADFIAEGVDQTRGWFYTLHAIATLVFGEVAYKNVVSNGLVLDKAGQKMSKRLGNAVDPFTTLAEYGPDATRWYMISNANPWDNLKFDIEGVAEVRRKFFGTLYNTYSFFALYANIDNFTYAEPKVPVADRPEIDRWILSELNTLIKNTDAFYAEYEPTRAARAISDFVQENLSNWYVRLCRRRFWKGEYAQDKIAAYQTLYTCLVTVAKLSAPIAPFFMDRLYKDLTQASQSEEHDSVHLAEFPVYADNFVDKSLESRMQKAQTISSLVLSLRKKEMIKVRQPLQRVMIPVLDAKQKAEIEAVAELIKAEVNVKEIELMDDASGVLVKNVKPNFKALGPRFGKDMGLVSKEIQAFTQDQIAAIDANGELDILVSGKNITLTAEDVEISSQDIPGWLVANADGLTVALDITITDELKKEGVARELVNRIQNIRKDSGFEVTDRIKVYLKTNAILQESVRANESYIKSETLTDELIFSDEVTNGTEIEFDDIKTLLLISK